MDDKSKTVEYLKDFYSGKNVYVTGAHGFKGTWLVLLLSELGATVRGVGLKDETNLMCDIVKLQDIDSVSLMEMDITHRDIIDDMRNSNPDLVFHLAAQPIVSEGYRDPYGTFNSNVMGTVNVMDSVRLLPGKCSFICVTTDKVYRNVEKIEPYVEDDELMGRDPYSASKSCAEIVAYSYGESFFSKTFGDFQKMMSTCRAGNVIGGGDFSINRIIPDLYRALRDQTPVVIRNFDGVRPYEHVLDALYAYVLLAAKQYDDPSLCGSYNIGPDDDNIIKTRVITDFFQSYSNIEIIDGSGGENFVEANLLSLDSTKFRDKLEWAPTWRKTNVMLAKTFDWYAKLLTNRYNMYDITVEQIQDFLQDK